MATRECIVEKGYALREVMIDIANNLEVPHTCHNFHRDNVWTYRYRILLLGRPVSSVATCGECMCT